MIKEELGSRVDGAVKALFPFLFWRPIDPNLLTVLGTLITCGAGVAFGVGEFRLAGLVMLAGGFFDLVDGVVARHFGTSTTFGGFLDSCLDRVADLAVFLGVIAHYVGAGELLYASLGSVSLISTTLTSYMKARAENDIQRLPGGLLERGERFGILAGAAVLGLVPLALWLLAIGTTYTALQRLYSAHREMSALDESRTHGLEPSRDLKGGSDA